MREGLAIDGEIQSPVGHSARRGASSPRCLIVMYHYVHDRFAGSDIIPPTGRGIRSLRIAEFESQLDRLSQELQPIGWGQLEAYLKGQRSLPARSFLLTFDDGLLEHAELVAPILERRGLRGLFFVPGSTLSSTTMMTAHSVHLLFELLGESQFETAMIQTLSNDSRWMDLSDEDEQRARRIYHYESPSMARLKFVINMKLPLSVRAAAIKYLFETHVGSQEDWAKRWYLSSSHVRELHAKGHAIGGHSFAHEPYVRLDEMALANDVNQCSSSLDSVLSRGRRPFAYPFGSVHPASAKYLSHAGFTAAFGTSSVWLDAESDPFQLPRVDTIHVGAMLEKTFA